MSLESGRWSLESGVGVKEVVSREFGVESVGIGEWTLSGRAG